MASFAASATIGSSAWVGLVGTGPVGWVAGIGLMVLGGIIDAKYTSKLFVSGNKDKNAQNSLLGLPVNDQGSGDPRIWAIGRRVRVPTHSVWQSTKRIVRKNNPGMKGAAATQTNSVVLDCAFAVNDRQTLRIAQVTGQGKLLTYSTRNLTDVTTSEVVVSYSAGRIILTMNSTSEPDWTEKFQVLDIVTMKGFSPAPGTIDLSVGYWAVYAVTSHSSIPSTITLTPVTGQVVTSVNSTAGVPEAPAVVTRVDDAVVHSEWDSIAYQSGNGGLLRLYSTVTPSVPSFDKVFQPGDVVVLTEFNPPQVNGVPGTVLYVTPQRIELQIPLGNLGSFVSGGTSSNRNTITYYTTQLFPSGIFPAGFIPADHYHSGTSTQTADATIEAGEGVGNAPGYRGVAYQVYEDFDVTIFGGGIPPMMTALIEPDSTMTWRDAVVNVCERSGVDASYVDVAGVLGTPFEGMFLRGATPGTVALQPIMVAQQLVTQERDGTIAFFHIDNADAVQIRNGARYSDFISPPGVDAKIAYEDAADADLPTSIGIRHQDPDTQYTEGYQFYGVRNPSASDAENRQEIDLSNLVLTRKQAANLAGTLMRRAYINSRQIRMQLPANYLHVLENDLLTVTDDDGNDLTVRVIRRDIGANFLVQVTAVVEEVALDVVGSPVQSEAGNVNRPPVRLAPVVGRVLDIPPVRDDDAFAPGLLLCGGPSGGGAWAGCSVYMSSNAGADWILIATISYQATVGRTASVLDAASPSEVLGDATPVWDAVSTVDIDIDSTSYTFPLVTASEASVLGGLNWFALRHEDGTYEIIGARDITQNSSTSYTLSYLLRGIRGTYQQSANDLPIGAEITMISFLPATDGSIYDASGMSGDRDLEFRFTPPGYDVSDVDSVVVNSRWRNCRPFPVRDITKTINGSNDVRFTVDNWTRTNIPVSQVGPYPMDETYEAYRFDLYDPTGVSAIYSRTITSTGSGSPTLRDKWVEFSSAEITLAGYTPGPSETFFVDVVQIGDYGDSPSVLQEL